MADNDDPKVQRARIERVVKEMEPNGVVVFDPDAKPNWIKFRITHGGTGATLVPSSGEYYWSEIADKSDQRLKGLISSLSGGKIR